MGALAALILLGCAPLGGASAQDAAVAAGKPIIDISKLANKDPDQVAAVLGTPFRVVKIKDDFNLMPGDDRYYKPKMTGKVVGVRFHRRKAVYFDIQLPKAVKDARAALALVGLKPTDNPYLDVRTATRWRDEISGFVWKDVSAIHTGSSDVGRLGYDQIFATLLEPEG